MWKFLVNKVVALRQSIARDMGGQGDVEKPFIEHLEDLRKAIVGSVITVLIATVLCFYFEKELLDMVQYPIHHLHNSNNPSASPIKLGTIGTSESFNMSLRVAFTTAVILAFPIVLFFILSFILPGLRHTEKRILWPSLAVGVGLFMVGALFGYFVIVPQMLEFFLSWDQRHDLSSEWRLADYVKMVSNFVLLSGLAFELPVVIMALVKLDILSFRVMNKNRGSALVLIAIVAAIITPSTDAMSLLMLAGPMYLLFEICIWLAWWMERRDKKLNPELYEDVEDIEVRDDWDTEEYRPWEELSRDFSEDDGEPPKDEYQRTQDEATSVTVDQHEHEHESEPPLEDRKSPEPIEEEPAAGEPTDDAPPTDPSSDIESDPRRDQDQDDRKSE